MYKNDAVISEDVAVSTLCAIVEGGEKAIRKAGITKTDIETLLVFFMRRIDVLLQREQFLLALRLALLITAKEIKERSAEENLDLWDVLPGALYQRLLALFPEEIAYQCADKATSEAIKDIKSGKSLFPEQELEKHYQYQDRARSKFLFESFRPLENPTYLVPCPKCGLKKRCDQKTKRFRCQCGFDSVYPLTPAAT